MSQEDTPAAESGETVDNDDTTASDDERRESFDRDYVEKLRRENAAARKRAQEAEQRAKEFEDRDKTEMEKAADRAQQAETRAQDAETRLLRHEIAAAKGVPARLVKYLTGSTREEMEASAGELLEDLGANRPNGDQFDAGRRGGGGAPTGTRSMDDLIRGSRGRG